MSVSISQSVSVIKSANEATAEEATGMVESQYQIKETDMASEPPVADLVILIVGVAFLLIKAFV